MADPGNNREPKLMFSPAKIVATIVIVVLLFLNQPGADDDEDTNETTEPPAVAELSEIESSPPRIKSLESETSPPDEAVPFLKEISPNVFESPAGLVYRSGSADGHRLKHVMKHAEDVPDKPVHGVFDGKRDEILALLDEVWKMSQERGPPTVQSKRERGRTVITADLGRQIGYVGGKSGARDNHPTCTRVRLVLEGANVITAYPMK